MPNRWPRENSDNFLSKYQIEISSKVAKRGCTLFFCTSFLGLKVETVTCGTSYKFALLKNYIIRSPWDIGHNIFLENPISIRLMALEIGIRGLRHFTISDLRDLKFQIHLWFNIELLQSEKRCVVFKILHKFVWKISLKEFKGHSEE